MKKNFCTIILFLLFLSVGYAQKINTLSNKEKRGGWELLFNGSNTNGWTTNGGKVVPSGWEVENGLLTVKKGLKGGDIVSEKEYSDFELSLDYSIEPGCNSGVKYFYTRYEKGGNLGFEYQILDDVLGEDNKLANHLAGSLYDVLPPNESKKKVNAPGKWNTIRIVAKGKNVEHWLNGKKILEFVRGSQAFTEAVAKSKFRQTMPAFGMVEKGRILLQEHGGEVSFRNIKIREL